MIRFELPYLPPTSNNAKRPLLIHGHPRLCTTKDATAFARNAVAAIKALPELPAELLDGPVVLHVTFFVPTVASDASNRIKLLEDAITASGVIWHDDKQVAELRVLKLIGEPCTRVVVELAGDAQPLLVERLEESRKNRARKAAKANQSHLGFDWRDDGPPRCRAVPNVRRSR